MTTDFAREPPAPTLPQIGVVPLAGRIDWRPWLGGALSLGLAAALGVQLLRAPPDAAGAIVRVPPAAWLAFVLLFLAQPVAELAIYGRIWGLPPSAFGILLRKAVLNEVVLGYSGEAYFYFWARKRTGMAAAPFGAIKDINILSALAGAVVTLALLAASWTWLHSVRLTPFAGPALWTGCGITAASLAVPLLGRRVFSLPPERLRLALAIQLARAAAVTALTLALWSLAMPEVPIGVWVVLATARLVIARLPFVPNKDLLFANAMFVMLGPTTAVAGLLGGLALATLAAHLAVIATLGASELVRSGRPA